MKAGERSCSLETAVQRRTVSILRRNLSGVSKERRALAAIALTTDTSALTALGNDYGFDIVFSRQIEALGKKGDVAIGISTSGNSKMF